MNSQAYRHETNARVARRMLGVLNVMAHRRTAADTAAFLQCSENAVRDWVGVLGGRH